MPFSVAKAGTCHHPRTGFDSRPVHVEFEVKKRDTVAGFPASMSVSSVSIIQHPHLNCFMSKASGVKQEP